MKPPFALPRLPALAALAVVLTAGCASPSLAQISVRSALSDDREVAPGTTYEGAILVANETDEPQQAKVYATDYLFHADGTNEYGAPGSTPRSNAAWVTFSPAVLTLPPGETVPVQYVVAVPEMVGGERPTGSYWSLLMVEAVPAASPESTLRPSSEAPRFGVRQVLRYGVQVATHVRGTGEVDLGLAQPELVQQDGGTVLRLDVANGGSRMARPDVWVELFDEGGRSQGRVDGTPNRLYPGTSVRQRIDLGALPPGSYTALVVLDAGGEDLYGAEYVLEL